MSPERLSNGLNLSRAGRNIGVACLENSMRISETGFRFILRSDSISIEPLTQQPVPLSYLSFRITIVRADNRIGAAASASAPSFSAKPYFPFAFSQASITAISFSCAVMMSCASFLTSASLPLARSTLAMSTAS